MPTTGFEPVKHTAWDLKPHPFDHSGTLAVILFIETSCSYKDLNLDYPLYVNGAFTY